MTSPKCTIDHDILNGETISQMHDIGLSFFASACGKNRGAFILDPPDGNTYGCLHFPSNIAELAGATDVDDSVVFKEANSIKENYVKGDVSGVDTVKILDFLVESVYNSSPNKDMSPYACEVSGLAKLDCNMNGMKNPRADGLPIRSVTLAGLFVPALWATKGEPLTLEQAKGWYTLDDFTAMKDLGINTVQISVPTAAFIAGDEYGAQVKEILLQILDYCATAGVQAILAMVSTGDELEAVVAASVYAAGNPAVLGLGLPAGMMIDTKTLIESIRVQAPALALFVPITEADFTTLDLAYDDNVYASLETSHIATVADVASSTSTEDRSKMFYHESLACIARSPLEFTFCFKGTPIFVSSGFDLGVDDCINKGIFDTFEDYGQCDRFGETIHSSWWHRHRQSFADRQVFAYERGLGWSFATWKLYNDDGEEGVMDSHAKLLSLKDVAAAGLFPDLSEPIPADHACLNPPENDFVLGDDTVAPTMGPPPDCGYGWWNYQTLQCDYWIPPPPPTPAPTRACPECEVCPEPEICPEPVTCPELAAVSSGTSMSTVVESGIVGFVLGVLCVFIYNKTCGKNKRGDYDSIPN